MSTNKLKAFVRLDGSKRIVPGSMVVRPKQPREGRWIEVHASGKAIFVRQEGGSTVAVNGVNVATFTRTIAYGKVTLGLGNPVNLYFRDKDSVDVLYVPSIQNQTITYEIPEGAVELLIESAITE